ncbi:MAG: PilZ domain-containing protein [Ectothiorhodospiraceae bacterium]|jgi:hypothetical protein
MVERRRQNRTILGDFYRIYDHDTGELIGRIVNLSRYGFLTIGDIPVEERRDLRVELVYADQQGRERRIPMRVECVWCRQSQYSDEYGGGFQIREIGEFDAIQVDRLVAEPQESGPTRPPA